MKVRWSVLGLLSIFFLLTMSGVGLADGLTINSDPNGLVEDINNAAGKFAGAVRGVFGVVTAAFIIWGGVLMLGAHGNSQKISDAKSKFTFALGALIIVFMAEKIVGVVMGIFGWSA